MALRHLLCRDLISRILKNLDLLWKRAAKESRFPISSSCPGDDGEPGLVYKNTHEMRNIYDFPSSSPQAV